MAPSVLLVIDVYRRAHARPWFDLICIGVSIDGGQNVYR